jgi:hypothetical protein
MKLNKEELLVGFLYGSCTWPALSWWAVLPGLICAFLWAVGGSGPKIVRRLGVPTVVSASMMFVSLWLGLLILPLWGIVSVGYGIPDKVTGDKGSALGRFYFRWLSYQAANWSTRFTVFIAFNIVIIVALAIVHK